MNAEIISVGTELILGSTLNTNAHYLSKRLSNIGIDVIYHTAVKDDPKMLEDIIHIGLKRADVLIFTGGLGPTDDDMTKEIVSKVLGLNLRLNVSVENSIKNYFNKTDKIMSSNNKKQAYIPEESKFLTNEIGTAPGIYIKWNEKLLILLPGPPNEMKLMFNKYVVPLIKQDFVIKISTIRTIGISESQLENSLKDIIRNNTNPTIATYAKEGTVDIKIVAKGDNDKEVDSLLNEIVCIIKNRISKYIYSYLDETIEEVVFKKLKDKKMKIAFCESCTGGLISAKFTRISGVSEVFERGIIAYSNNSKIEELNVNKDTLEKFGPVSEQVAIEMAKGLMNKTKSDIAVSTTGLAGPSGGNKTKPIGLVYIGIVTKNMSKVIKCMLNGDRTSIQNKAALKVFNEIRKIL
ncbi:competence/damage-inducible protein A [Schnuerera sp. xch1]|uniref:competence/damage-inducible protein A n=1 Tax=Schnuerera sp. xch1 TaxID=2874283 RepID=UPI001CC1297D|nr:competence/damage-inducible protein A [Schnuerera sp. xch1]MBZ2173818.1 competence/damage-inducible protein A [Schnuerera sp. xch1]